MKSPRERSTAWRAARGLGEQRVADYVSRILEAIAWEGWNPIKDHPEEMADQQQEDLLARVAADPTALTAPDDAALWLRNEMICRGGPPHAHADRLSRAMKSGAIRGSNKRSEIIQAVADYVRLNKRWPSRHEILVPGSSQRLKDAVFQELGDVFEIELDGRVKWVDSQ